MPRVRLESPRALLIGAVTTVLLASCATAPPSSRAPVGDLPLRGSVALDSAFQQAGVAGVFVVYRFGDDQVRVSSTDRARRAYLPASTFKVPNSLLALELGIVESDSTRFPMTWDTTEISSWNREHTFASALQFSVVPVYQIVARRMGEERYRHWLPRLAYGNADPGGGIDHFWLDGDLRTSATEQVDFLTRLATMSLPLSERSQRIVHGMMKQPTDGCYELYGKTGLVGVAATRAIAPEERVGWYVGWVRWGADTSVFALNLDVRRPDDAGKRTTIALQLLARTGAIPTAGAACATQPQR